MNREVRHDSYEFLRDDLLAIEDILYRPVDEELVARKVFKINDRYPAWSEEVGYNYYDRKGSAKILASGAAAKDVPIIGGGKDRVVQKVYTIATGIQYSKQERQANAAQKTLAKGATVNLDTIRVEDARRFVAEAENRLAFVGDEDFGIAGILNHPGIISKEVSPGKKGSDADGKRLWANKTPQEKLADLLNGKKEIEKDGLFQARVCVLSQEAYLSLLEPFSDSTTVTVLEWILSKGGYFPDGFVATNQLNADYNGLDVNAFAVLDNRPSIVELVVPEDLNMEAPDYDLLGNSEMAVTERCAGIMLRHPSGVYVGKGI